MTIRSEGTESYQTPVSQPKIMERKVQLDGMEHSVLVRIQSSETLDDKHWHEAFNNTRNTISEIAKELDLSSGQFRFEFSSSGKLEKIENVGSQTESEENQKIATVFKKFATTTSSSTATAAATETPAATMDPKLLAETKTQLRRDSNLQVPASKISEIARLILTGTAEAQKRASETKQTVLLGSKDSDVQVAITKKGKVYVRTVMLGAGVYKETYQYVKVGTLVQQTFAALPSPAATKLKALSTEKIRQGAPSKTAVLEHENEMELHRELTARRKEAQKTQSADPLEHVAASKTVVPLSSEISGEGLMGAYYNGGTVDARLKNDLTGRECARICADLLKGTEELHALHIVHRDLKSDNVLLEVKETNLPKNEWPPNLSPGNVPKGYRVTFHPFVKNEVMSVTKIEIVRAVICDLGKASHTEEEKRAKTSLLYFTTQPPDSESPDRVFSETLDVYQAGRTAYQIFAGIPLGQLSSIYSQTEESERIQKELYAAIKLKNETGNPATRKELNSRISKLTLQYQTALKHGPIIPPDKWPQWDRIPAKVQEHITKMVDPDPVKRPTAQESRVFFDSLKDQDLELPTAQSETSTTPNVSHGYAPYAQESDL